MQPESIKRLIEYFIRLPGIGPRQASRFAFTLLDEDQRTIEGFVDALREVARSVSRCTECFRAIENGGGATLCQTCRGDIHAILIVEKDQDHETIAKTGIWQDAYHVLGGTISLLNEKTRVTERIKSLYERLERRATKEKPIEVALATSATTEGDSTAMYIERVLEPFIKDKRITLTRLGRGISTGTEMEYADPATLSNALKNRK
ncbi:MAG: toprim domain-containing protein [Patescibacteria group bacterium]